MAAVPTLSLKKLKWGRHAVFFWLGAGVQNMSVSAGGGCGAHKGGGKGNYSVVYLGYTVNPPDRPPVPLVDEASSIED